MRIELEKDMLSRLRKMRMSSMADAYEAQMDKEPDYVTMPFSDRFGELVDAAWNARADNRFSRLAKQAGIPIQHACLENLDRSAERRLDVNVIEALGTNAYISRGHNIIITGAAGSGKTYLACALAQSACREGYKARYCRSSELIEDFALGDNSQTREELKLLTKLDLLILDEFLLREPKPGDMEVLYEIVQLRCAARRSTIFCSPWKEAGWHTRMGGGPLAESILDRVETTAFHLSLDGKVSLREKYDKPSLEDILSPERDSESPTRDSEQVNQPQDPTIPSR